MQDSIKRRTFLAATVVTALSNVHVALSAESAASSVPWRVGFNTSTIREFKLTLEQEIDIAYQAGFRSVELWSERIRKYREQGKSLTDLRKRMADRGMKVESLIGFATWIVNDPNQRRQGLETMREEMLFAAELGAPCIAAPASGAWKEKIEGIELCAQRYRDILDLGRDIGVRPMLELWGTSPTLSKLPDLLAIAASAQRTNAALLLDAYHLYRGGNSFESLALVAGNAMPVFHLNDWPAGIPRDSLADKDRVYPGDGACPFDEIIPILLKNGFNGVFSLELFNREYQKNMTPLQVAQTGWKKMQSVLKKYS